MKSGEGSTIDLPNPELFDCSICGVSVKYKREHLNKKHQVNKMYTITELHTTLGKYPKAVWISTFRMLKLTMSLLNFGLALKN